MDHKLEKTMKLKKNKSRCALLGFLLFSLIGTAAANQKVSARSVNDIQTKQAKSIEMGVELGRLTPKEARKLRKEQYEITNIERAMREDGALNAVELSKLFKKLQYAQGNINELLRNEISTHGQSFD